MAAKKRFRIESDTLGRVKVPSRAYYGAGTRRATENFPISSIRQKPVFIKATAMVKKAACAANFKLGLLDGKRASAITRAADEIISGKLFDEFVVDVYQAGAGTSHNMNANEVIANRASVILGGKKGEYKLVHPNDHVNMAQSTNDVFPTAMRLAALISSEHLLKELNNLKNALRTKTREFRAIIKSGRTHLQDAVPVSLGSEFGSYSSSVGGAIKRISASAERLKRIGLGATAAGTGLNSHPKYRRLAIKTLSKISGITGLKPAPDTYEALNSMADFSSFSASLKDLSVELIRIANDLRLLSSGPRTGLAEIKLPAVQPGSSIMPGKVNPVMAEMLDMVCFQVIGNDLAVTFASQAGQLELNVMMPVICHNILQSVEILTNALRVFTQRCVLGIKADRKKCAMYFENSIGLATALNMYIGYDRAAQIAKLSAKTGRTVKEITIEKGILTEKEWGRLFRAENITRPVGLKKLGIKLR